MPLPKRANTSAYSRVDCSKQYLKISYEFFSAS